MNIQFFFKYYKWLCFLFFLVSLDVGIKCWIRSNFFIGKMMNIVPGVNLCYLSNAGLAFGLFAHMKTCYRWILIYIILFIIIFFCFGLYKSIKNSVLHDSIAYTMIIGGSLGNLYDRIFYGAVIDFIDLYIGTWHWPIFNVADIEIFIGMLFLILRWRILQSKDVLKN